MPGHQCAKWAEKRDLAVSKRDENIPPKKRKRSVSVATLFESRYELRCRADKETDVLDQRTSGVFKSRTGRTSEQHPIYRKFLEASKGYRQGAAEGQSEELKPVYEDLIAKVDELAVVDAATTISDIALEQARLAKPLAEDKIEVQRTAADGTTTAQECKLSDTMQIFERVLERKRGEIEQLLRELNAVDSEIAVVKEDIDAVERKEVNTLKCELDAQVASLIQQAHSGQEATLAQIEKSRKQDKKAKEDQSKKFEEFMRSIF